MAFVGPRTNGSQTAFLTPCLRRGGSKARGFRCSYIPSANTMTPDHLRASHGLAFHHPLAFWAGCALIITGVASHMPMFMMGRHTHWQMVGMPMDAWMLWGMAMIPAGVVLAGFGLMPRRSEEHTSELQSLMRISYAVFG